MNISAFEHTSISVFEHTICILSMMFQHEAYALSMVFQHFAYNISLIMFCILCHSTVHLCFLNSKSFISVTHSCSLQNFMSLRFEPL